jgi:hypothetical protein
LAGGGGCGEGSKPDMDEGEFGTRARLE